VFELWGPFRRALAFLASKRADLRRFSDIGVYIRQMGDERDDVRVLVRVSSENRQGPERGTCAG
jgi:hypothetical protein